MSEEAKAQILSAVRSTLIALGAYAVGKGLVGQAVVDQIVPAVIVLATAVWGVLDKKQK